MADAPIAPLEETLVLTEPELQQAPNGTMTARVCDYFGTERGCVKAERCDFLHTAEGKKSQSELAADASLRLCDFFLTERGCVKEDRCDFLHPTAPNGTVTKRLCEYFGTNRGCVKELRCDFLHLNAAAAMKAQQCPVAPPAFPAPGAFGYPYGMPPPVAGTASDIPGMRPFVNTQAQSTNNTRVCSYYQEPRGCAKDVRCDFIHQGPAAAPAAPVFQDPLLQLPGSAADPYAAYYGYAAAPGAQPAADSLYAASGYGAAAGYNAYLSGAPPAAAPPAAAGSERVCSFFLTARGCRKGTRCDFAHPSTGAKQTTRYSPY